MINCFFFRPRKEGIMAVPSMAVAMSTSLAAQIVVVVSPKIKPLNVS
jgi:hypothetical protein